MNHSRDANVPIYLVPTLLRLTFSRGEGNERPQPSTLLSLVSPGLQFTHLHAYKHNIHMYMYVKRRSISGGRENTYRQRRETDWQIPATEYMLVNHRPVWRPKERWRGRLRGAPRNSFGCDASVPLCRIIVSSSSCSTRENSPRLQNRYADPLTRRTPEMTCLLSCTRRLCQCCIALKRSIKYCIFEKYLTEGKDLYLVLAMYVSNISSYSY